MTNILGIGAFIFALLFPQQTQRAVETAIAKTGEIFGPPTRDIDTLARTLWGEARGEGPQGMQAVANVIMTRYALRQGGIGYRSFGPVGASVYQICTADQQFSAWNPSDPNRAAMLKVGSKDTYFQEALKIAQRAVNGTLPDITDGADHYHTTDISPTWARGHYPVEIIGNHVFYNITNRGTV